MNAPMSVRIAPAATATSPGEVPLGSLLVPRGLTVWGWVLGYTAVLSSLSILRYHLWLAGGHDPGLFQQALWLLAHRGLHAVSAYTGQLILTNVSTYSLAVLAPFYAVGGLGFLLVLQSFALGLGYLFIHKIGTTLGVSERASHLVGLMYLMSTTMLAADLFDFHPEALGVPILFGLIWSAIVTRWLAYSLLLMAALPITDTMPLLLIGAGLALLLRRNAAWGLITVTTGFLAGYLEMGHPLTQHLALLNWRIQPSAWMSLASLFGPLAGVVATLRTRVLTPWWIPGMMLVGANLLSPSPFTSPFNQMTILGAPFFFAAALEGLRWRGTELPGRREAAVWLIPSFLLLTVFAWHEYTTNWQMLSPNAEALQAGAAVVPKEAPVVTQDFIAPHLADRDQLWTPGALRASRPPAGTYAILEPSVDTGVAARADLALLQAALMVKGQAAVVFSRAGVTVYRLLRPLPPLTGVDRR